MFKDIRSCRLMSVYQHILIVSTFRVRRINYSYSFTNIYQSTRLNITEDMSLHHTSSVLSRMFLQKLIFAHVGIKFPTCFVPRIFITDFAKPPNCLHPELNENIWHDDTSNCVLEFKKDFLINDDYLQNLFLLFYFSPTQRL